LGLTVVADGYARSVDAVGQCRVGNDPSVPDGLQQLVLTNHAGTIADEVNEQVEDLGLDRHERVVSAQFTRLGVQRTALKKPTHGFASGR
jgi:hypothetical protein